MLPPLQGGAGGTGYQTDPSYGAYGYPQGYGAGFNPALAGTATAPYGAGAYYTGGGKDLVYLYN